jgi:hypothetical protein
MPPFHQSAQLFEKAETSTQKDHRSRTCRINPIGNPDTPQNINFFQFF